MLSFIDRLQKNSCVLKGRKEAELKNHFKSNKN